MKILLFISLIILFLTGCKSKTVYIPVESIKMEYRERLQRDSIHLYDSVFVREKGDTIWMEKYKYLYRDRLKVDTIRRDSIVQIPYPVIEVKETNKFHTWQIILMVLGGVFIGFIGYRLVNFFKGR